MLQWLIALCIGLAALPTAAFAQISMSPSYDAIGSTGPNPYTFTIENDGSRSTTALLQVSCSGAVTSCSASASSVPVGANGGQATVTVSYSTSGNSTGSFTLTATDRLTQQAVQSTVDVTMPNAQPSVTASTSTAYTAENFNTSGLQFTVTNTGTTSAQYTLSLSCSGNISGCSVSSPTGTLAHNQQATVSVSFTPGAATGGNGTISLTATGPANLGSQAATSPTVTVVPLSEAVQVTPDGATAALSSSGVDTVPVTVHETGNAGAGFRYALTASCSGTIVGCVFLVTGADTMSLPPAPGVDQQVKVILRGTSDLSGGYGALSVVASYNNGVNPTYQDEGSYGTTIPDTRTYTVGVGTPTGTTDYTAEQVSTNYVFSVTNNGNTQATYTLTVPTCSGTESGCSPAQGSITLAPGTSANIPVNFTTLAAGQNGTVALEAAYGSTTGASPTVTIVPLSEAVQVTPDGGTASLAVNGTTIVPFTVHETGNAGSGFSYTLTASCAGSVVGCVFASTGTNSTTVPPGPGSDQVVQVTLTGTSDLAGGTGTVGVTASTTNSWNQTYQDQGSYSVTVPDSRVGLPLSIVTPTDRRDPSVCVANCFDATYAYSTPTYTSLDVSRSLTIGYRSSLAHPVGTVSIDAIDTTASGARQISVKVWHGSTPVTFTNGTTESFFAGVPGINRLTVQYDASQLAPGVSRDSVVVTAYLNDGSIHPARIIVPTIVLNAGFAQLGSGWSVVGLVQGFVQPNGDVVVTDGDGDASVYVKPTGCSYACTFTAPIEDFRTLVGPDQTTGMYTLRAPDGTVATLDGSGHAVSTADRLGNATQYTYTLLGALQTVTDPAGQVTTLAYGTQPTSRAIVLQSITTPGGRTTQVTVDSLGNLTQIVRPDGSYGFYGVYDSAHRLTRWYDRATVSGGNVALSSGDEWDVTYDSAQKVSSVTEPQLVADGVTVRPVVAYASIETSMIALPGANNGTAANPVAHVDTTALHARVTDARGNVTTYTLDRADAPIRVDEPRGRTTTMQRDNVERVSQITTPGGDHVTYTYSGPDLITTVDGYTGRTVHMDYESTFHQVTRVYGDADSVWNYWSPAGLLDSTRAGTSAHPVTAYTYDSRGRVVSQTQSGYTDSVHYASSGWQNTDTTITSGRTSSQHFNSWGLVDQVTDAAGYTSQMLYDGLGRIQMAIGPRADTTMYYYDALFLTGVKDAKGQLYQYVRNGLGWTTQQIDPRNTSTYFGYDRNGNVTSTTNRRGQTITAAYDSLDNMTRRIAGTDTATYATDPLDRFTAVTNVESIDTVTYDPAGQMTSEIAVRKGVRYARTSTYDVRGERTGVAFTSQPWGTSVSTGYRYDALERLDSLIDQAGGATVITYDSLGRPISTTLPNGMNIGTPFANLLRPTDLTYSTGTVNSAVGASYAYGPRGELTDRLAPSLTAGRQFDTDAEGQLIGFENYTMTSGVCKYQQMPPDPPERVCTGPGKSYGGASASYSWDKVGNPTFNGAVVDTGNRLRQFGADSLAYDPDGNLIGRYQNHALVESYAWDVLGQLTSVTLGTTTLNFGYDGFGRRVRKKVTVNGAPHTTNYFHDGDNLWIVAIADGKQLVSVTTSYPGIDQPHSIYQNGAISYYLQDVSGNITGLVNTAGALQNHYSYLPFGAADTTVEAVTNTLKFAAREYDAEVGLYYLRARYYDPGLGRFISEDPIGLAGGVNPYAYTNNAPLDVSDALGLDDSPDWRKYCNHAGGTYTELDSQSAICVVGSGPVTLSPVGVNGWANPSPIGYPASPGVPDPHSPIRWPAYASPRGPGTVPPGSRPTTLANHSLKWHDLKCQVALADMALSGVETGVFLFTVAPEALTAGSIATASEVVLGSVAKEVGTTLFEPDPNSIQAALQAGLVGAFEGKKLSIPGYLQAITPGLNVWASYREMKEFCM